MTDLINLVFEIQFNFFRRFLTVDHKFSTKFKSGEFLSHSKKFIFIFFNPINAGLFFAFYVRGGGGVGGGGGGGGVGSIRPDTLAANNF